jgi:hypothetical protein
MRGLLVILVDESSAMQAVVSQASKKSLLESVSTAVNSLMGRLAQGKEFDLALVGYHSEDNGAANVACRWRGSLGGRQWVATSSLAAAPVTVEQRNRKVVVDGQLQEQSVSFPVWYQSQPAGKAPQVAAFGFCRQLISDWATCQGTEAAQPILMHVFAGPSADGNSLKVVREIQQTTLPGGSPLVFQAHLISSETMGVPATLYPATPAYLTGQARELYERTSVLPDALAAHLKNTGVVIQPKARGVIYNGRMVDLAKFLTVVDAYVEQLPALSVPPAAVLPSAPPLETPPSAMSTENLPPAPVVALAAVPADAPPVEPISLANLPGVAELGPVAPADGPTVVAEPIAPAPLAGIASLTPEQPGLLLLVLDRSVTNPYGAEPKNACTRLQQRLGDLLEKVVRFGHGTIDVGIISYGSDSSGQTEVRGSLEGALVGRPYARDSELTAGAIRIEQFDEERSDGAGGILSIPHKQPILVEVEPAPTAPALPAFQKAGESAVAWLAEHPGDANVPMIVHLTRGQLDTGDAEQAVGQLTASVPGAIVYHIVETEADHVSMFYPAEDTGLQDPSLKTLWRLTSPLLDREGLIADNPQISEHARGMVVNTGGELLLDALKRGVAV